MLEHNGQSHFFADTSRIDEIKKMLPLGIFTGITTNPGIVANDSPESDPIEGYKKMTAEFTGIPISIQLLDEPLNELIEQGRRFARISPDVVIKVPMFGDGRGLCAMATLIPEKIKINATALMSAEQATVALQFNPHYVSLFFNRMKDYGTNPLQEISNTRELIERDGANSKIIVGSIRRPQDIREALTAGAHIVTITPKVFWSMVYHPKTEEFIQENQRSWESLVTQNGKK